MWRLSLVVQCAARREKQANEKGGNGQGKPLSFRTYIPVPLLFLYFSFLSLWMPWLCRNLVCAHARTQSPCVARHLVRVCMQRPSILFYFLWRISAAAAQRRTNAFFFFFCGESYVADVRLCGGRACGPWQKCSASRIKIVVRFRGTLVEHRAIKSLHSRGRISFPCQKNLIVLVCANPRSFLTSDAACFVRDFRHAGELQKKQQQKRTRRRACLQPFIPRFVFLCFSFFVATRTDARRRAHIGQASRKTGHPKFLSACSKSLQLPTACSQKEVR